MAISKQIYKHELIKWAMTDGLVEKTMFDQLAMNDFDVESNPCMCEIREVINTYIAECYDNHFGNQMTKELYLLEQYARMVYKRFQLMVNDDLDVYEDEVIYTDVNGEEHHILGHYLNVRSLIINEYEDTFTEMLFDIVFESYGKEEEETEKEEMEAEDAK